ncbi:MAG: hypothetical protein Q8P12_05490 [bacterium]|nr:hypothetical protein [bacterium]MDZ4346779.1 hypothetical protein [Candidatus Binatia bacterium]
MNDEATYAILEEVFVERCRQEEKWGYQDHYPGVWSLILSEEVGESAKAALEHNAEDYRKELIQVAAVAVAAIEAQDCKDGK